VRAAQYPSRHSSDPRMEQVHKVIVSSTFRDLRAERAGVRDVILGRGMLALMMERDSAIPDQGLLSNSRKMVEQADLYVLLLSNYRYGQIIADPANPKGLSITELEFEWADVRGLPICAYLMDKSLAPPRPPTELAEDVRHLDKLLAFRARATFQPGHDGFSRGGGPPGEGDQDVVRLVAGEAGGSRPVRDVGQFHAGRCVRAAAGSVLRAGGG
jgi:hypothetical protein